MSVLSNTKPCRLIAAVLLSLGLVACGGGGGGGPSPGDGGTNPPGPTDPTDPTEPTDPTDPTDPTEPENQPPVAVISGPESGVELVELELSAAASSDADGDDLTFSWEQVAGSPASIVDGTDTAVLTIQAPKVEIAETLAFRVTVSDGETSASAEHQVQITEGQGVVFLGRASTDSTLEVFRRHDSDSAPVQISRAAQPAEGEPVPGNVSDLAISPDRRHVAYLRHFDDGTTRLMVAGIDGRGERNASGEHAHGGLSEITAFAWAPNDARLVFRADLGDIDDQYELYGVAIAADGTVGDRHKLSGTMHADSAVKPQFAWSPDGSRVAFISDRESVGVDRLYVTSVGADGASGLEVPAIASTPPIGNGDVYEFKWSPDGTRVAYRANIINESTQSLYVSAISADARTLQINGSPVETINGTEHVKFFAWSPDSQYLAARGNFDASGAENDIVLRKIRLDGSMEGDSRIINGPLPTNGDTHFFTWSPNSRAIAMSVAIDQDGTFQQKMEIYVINLGADGNSANQQKVSPDTNSPELGGSIVSWSPDGKLLAFRGDFVTDGEFHVFAAANDPVAGTSTVMDLTSDVLENVVGTKLVWKDARSLAFIGREPDGRNGVHLIRLDDFANRVAISSVAGNIVEGGNVSALDSPVFSPDGKNISFVGDLETDETFSIFSTRLNDNDAFSDRTNVSAGINPRFKLGFADVSSYHWFGPPTAE